MAHSRSRTLNSAYSSLASPSFAPVAARRRRSSRLRSSYPTSPASTRAKRSSRSTAVVALSSIAQSRTSFCHPTQSSSNTPKSSCTGFVGVSALFVSRESDVSVVSAPFTNRASRGGDAPSGGASLRSGRSARSYDPRGPLNEALGCGLNRRYRPYARNTERNAASVLDADVVSSVSVPAASPFATSTRAASSRSLRAAACFARMSRSLVSFRNSAESSVEEIRPATLALFAYRGFEDQCRSSGCLPDRCSLASMAFTSVRSRYARNARSASTTGISSTMSSAEKSAMVVVARAIAT